MTDEIAPHKESAPSPPARPSGGRLLAGLGVLFGLAGAAGAAYLYYALVLLDPAAGIAQRVAELQTNQRQFQADLSQLGGEQQAVLERIRNEQEQGRQRAEKLLEQKLEALAAPEPVSEQAWKLAEVEYLLRVANQRVLMERDVKTALRLLQSADGILAELDDYAMHGVRATLASEILSLEQFATADVSGIYLRLDAVKRQLSTLTLALPAFTLERPARAPLIENAGLRDEETYSSGAASATPGNEAVPVAPANASRPRTSAESADTAATDSTASEASGLLDALALELGKLVRVRRIDSGLKPPLAPTEAKYLELNLRLMLEQAQLAVLKYDQAVYAASLDSALEWVHTYLDAQDSRVRETTTALHALRALDLATPIPDISGSLNELMQAQPQVAGQTAQ